MPTGFTNEYIESLRNRRKGGWKHRESPITLPASKQKIARSPDTYNDKLLLFIQSHWQAPGRNTSIYREVALTLRLSASHFPCRNATDSIFFQRASNIICLPLRRECKEKKIRGDVWHSWMGGSISSFPSLWQTRMRRLINFCTEWNVWNAGTDARRLWCIDFPNGNRSCDICLRSLTPIWH